MKNFLKGVAAVVIVMVISILIHMFFNMKGIELPIGNYVEIMLTSSFATLIYHVLIKNRKNEEDRK